MANDIPAGDQRPAYMQRIEEAVRSGNWGRSGLDAETVDLVRRIQSGVDIHDPELQSRIDTVMYAENADNHPARYALMSVMSARLREQGLRQLSQRQEEWLDQVMEATRENPMDSPLPAWEEPALQEALRAAITEGPGEKREQRVRDTLQDYGRQVPLGLSALFDSQKLAEDEVGLDTISPSGSSGAILDRGQASGISGTDGQKQVRGGDSEVDLGGGGFAARIRQNQEQITRDSWIDRLMNGERDVPGSSAERRK